MTDDELRDRALRNLLRAFQEAGRELTYEWVEHDPDFQFLRSRRDPAWVALMERLAPRQHHEPSPASKKVAADIDSVLSPEARPEPRRPVPVPARPLGRPGPRLAFWLAVAIGVPLVAIAFLVAVSAPAVAVIVIGVPVAVLALGAANRAYVARFELEAVRRKRP